MLGNVSKAVTEGHEKYERKLFRSLMNSTAAESLKRRALLSVTWDRSSSLPTTQFIIIMILMMQLHFPRCTETQIKPSIVGRFISIFHSAIGFSVHIRKHISVLPDA